MENNQKTALITGGTSGIGKELAKLFAQDKYNLIIVARGLFVPCLASELRALVVGQCVWCLDWAGIAYGAASF